MDSHVSAEQLAAVGDAKKEASATAQDVTISRVGDVVDTERDMSIRDAFRIWPKAILFSFIISLTIIMEGYDTALMSNFFAYPAFVNRYGDQVDAKGNTLVSARWQTIIINSAYVGSIIGVFLNGFITDWLGYRKTLICTMVFMIGANFVPFFSTGLPMFLAGELIQGLPWGIFSTLGVSYAADICPLQLRGYMTSWVNICWVIGQLIAVGILNAFIKRPDEWSYRIPFAVQWVWPLPIIAVTYFAPESPWWLIRKGRQAEARAAMARLLTPRADVPFSLDSHMEIIRLTVKFEEKATSGPTVSYLDCFRGANLRRTEIASLAWLTPAFCGAPFMGYGIQYMIQAGLDPNNGFALSLGQTGISLVGCLIAWYIMTVAGRRAMYLIGLGALTLILFTIGCLGLAPSSNSGASWAIGGLILLIVFVFQLTVGPSCYTIVAEAPSAQLRIKTVAVARVAYSAGGFVIGALTPQMIGRNAWNWGAKGAFFWAGIASMFLVWTWFRLPETKGLTTSDIDLLFEYRVPTRSFGREAADCLRPKLRDGASSNESVDLVPGELRV